MQSVFGFGWNAFGLQYSPFCLNDPLAAHDRNNRQDKSWHEFLQANP